MAVEPAFIGSGKRDEYIMSDSSIDPAFICSGKREGMELWRIEDLKPVRQAQVLGKLYTGDSYILLVTQKKR